MCLKRSYTCRWTDVIHNNGHELYTYYVAGTGCPKSYVWINSFTSHNNLWMRCCNHPRFVDTETQKEHSQGYTAFRWRSGDWDFRRNIPKVTWLLDGIVEIGISAVGSGTGSVNYCVLLYFFGVTRQFCKNHCVSFLSWNMVTYWCLRKAFPLLKPAHLRSEGKLCVMVKFFSLLMGYSCKQQVPWKCIFLKPPSDMFTLWSSLVASVGLFN